MCLAAIQNNGTKRKKWHMLHPGHCFPRKELKVETNVSKRKAFSSVGVQVSCSLKMKYCNATSDRRAVSVAWMHPSHTRRLEWGERNLHLILASLSPENSVSEGTRRRSMKRLILGPLRHGRKPWRLQQKKSLSSTRFTVIRHFTDALQAKQKAAACKSM